MILLGGDLFHDNKPSRKTLYETMKLIRTYCFEGKKCDLELENDKANAETEKYAGFPPFFFLNNEVNN